MAAGGLPAGLPGNSTGEAAATDSRSGQVYLKIVNPGAGDVPAQIAFGGRNAQVAAIEVLGATPSPCCG